jgi:hypothetical protein
VIDAEPVEVGLLAKNDNSVQRMNPKRRKALAIALTLT